MYKCRINLINTLDFLLYCFFKNELKTNISHFIPLANEKNTESFIMKLSYNNFPY